MAAHPTQVTVTATLAREENANGIRKVYGNIIGAFDDGNELQLFDHLVSDPVEVAIGKEIPLDNSSGEVELTAKTLNIKAHPLKDAVTGVEIANNVAHFKVGVDGSKGIDGAHGHINVKVTWDY